MNSDLSPRTDSPDAAPVSERIRARIQRAGQRFHANDNIAAFVEPGELEALLDEVEGCAIPAAHQSLLPLLKRIVSDLGPDKMPEPHAFDDAAWVGYRLTEILPVQALAKQKLLELDEPISRLEILHTYLAQRELVK